ncbi:hypothetical protein Z517_09245 [Fonsecaea pedrosoi CBS 271.37]|uniref:Uncharacterized protein n=1 Tax=Fonsecaea pedrosoi CBS 271.37 TaxID=1442368 RepID=A0A0D2DGI9_9EURO|nr:uncharacterized protein Z517_09245 [Fonsecaea pedrosoi CBS 271.37]KIW76801.1 hypothetical protein Z517_09245 [Fonsecaea pedrosoi CBS 271.37]
MLYRPNAVYVARFNPYFTHGIQVVYGGKTCQNELVQRQKYSAYHKDLGRGKQMKESHALFPKAEFMDCPEAGRWSLCVLDSDALQNQIIAAKLGQVLFDIAFLAMDKSMIASIAKVAADTAMQLYQ